MAGKYWWRDEETETVEQDSSKTTSQPGNKYWWRDDKTTSTGASGQNQDSGAGKYWWRADSANTVGENLTNRVNTWLENHNNYITNYQTRNSGRKFNYEDSYVSDSADWLNTISQQKSAFDTEADSILAQLDQYKGYFNDEWVESVRKTLTDARSAQDIILANSTKDNEWWSSFGNEELVNAFGSAEDAYKYYQRSDGYRQKYAGQKYDDIQKALSTLEDGEEKDWLTSNQYEFYKDDATYNSKSRSGWKSFEAQKIAEWKEEESKTWFDKAIESFATTPADTSLPNAGLINAQVAYTNDTSYKEPNEKWSADQRNQFGYLWATDRDKAYEYAVQVNSQIADYEEYLAQQGAQQDATKNGWTMTGHTIGAIASAPLALGDLLGDLVEYSARGTITSDGMLSPFEYSQAVQSGIANKLNKVDENGVAQSVLPDWVPIVGGKGWGDVYSLGVSAANSLVSAYTMGGAGTLINFIGQGGASGVDEALSRGASPGQALLYGAIVGAAEGATEMLSADKLIKVGSASTLKNYLLKALGQGVGEFAEEGVSSVIGNIADNIIMQDKSNFYDTVEQIMDKNPGMSEEEAKTKAWLDMVGDIAFDALGGFVTGATNAMTVGGVNTAVDAWKGNQQNIDAVKKYGGNTDAIIREGLQNDKKTDSYKLAEKYRKQIVGTEKKAGKAMTGFQIRNLLAANQAEVTKADLEKIQNAAANRLAQVGQREDIYKIAELATKYATGQEMTRSERSTLARSSFGSQVASELLDGIHPDKLLSKWENDMSGESGAEYSTDWTGEIGTESDKFLRYNNEKLVRTILEKMANMQDPAAYKSLESRVEAEEPAQVSDTGKSVIRGTEQEVDLAKPTFKKITDGVGVLETNGESVNANDIDYADADLGYAIKAVGKIENITPEAAGTVVSLVDTTKPVVAQMNALDEAFTYGFHNYSEADLKAGLFTKNLTEQQLNDAYKLGQYVRDKSTADRTAAIKKMRTAADAIAEKAAAEGKEAPKSKKLTITYNHGGGVVEEISTTKKLGKLEEEQRGGFEAAKILHQMGIGTDYEFFTSYFSKTLKDEDGNPLEVFLNDEGQEEAAYAGIHMAADGKIRINLNAYSGTKGLTLNALSHELTHFIKTWNLEKYEAMAEFLVKSYGEKGVSMHKLVLKEQARLQNIRKAEVSYSEAYDEVVANAFNRMLEDGKVMDRIAEIRQFDKSLGDKILDGIRKFIERFFEVYRKNQSLFHETKALMEMKEVFEQLQNMFAEALVEASDNFQAAQQVGFELDTQTESVAPAVSLKSENTWKQSDYVQERDKAAKEIAKAIGVTEKKAKDYIDSINSIAKMIAEDRSRLDYFSSPGRTSFVGNVEYGGSFDFSTLCKKRRLLTGTFTAIQKALPNTALTANEILDIRNRMKKANLEVSCGLCYVEGSRANMGQFAKEFLRLYKQYYPDAWQPNMADVNTPDGIEWVRINHPECYEQYEYFWNHYGTLKDGDKNLFASQQKPKLYQLHTEYKGEILDKFKGDDNVEEKNLNGGIRLQSFSDFEIVHLIDTMQIIMDMSRVGLSGQAYTKVPDFAWALGDTGLKINLSLIAKGVDENGKLIFDDVEGMPIAEAMKLRDRYSKNVGTILVAFNDEQLLAAMADDRVDFIIPFHRSQWKKSQYEAMGLPAKTKDYTFMQNEKYIKPQFHEYRGRMVKDKATNYMPNEYWDFSKSGKENAEAYLEMCARNNKRPKFYKLLQNNGDGSYSLKADGSTDGYWKLLIDFKMYDNDGNGSPQMAVKPEFNMEEANRMLNAYKGGHSNFPVAQGIVDGFVKDYKASHKGVQYSSQQTDVDYNKPIELSDVFALRSIGRKSVNQFTAEDIQKAQKWAYKYFKDIGVKSPFFRAWFGDWRAVDKTAIEIIPIPTISKEDFKEFVKTQRGTITNKDTAKDDNDGWQIRISSDGENNTRAHAGGAGLSVEALTAIKSLVENSILLDTEVHEHHSNNSKSEQTDRIAFDHKLYSLGMTEDNRVAVYRITIEEKYQDKKHPHDLRFHNLKYIEKVADFIPGLTYAEMRSADTFRDSSTTIYSVSDLYEFVKKYDGEFNAGEIPSAGIVNADGTPKVMYHGTRAENGEFYVFDYSKAVKKGGLGLKALGKGNYFTAKKLDGTERYGSRVIEAYLRIKTPFVYNGGSNLWEQVANELGVNTDGMNSDDMQQLMRDHGYDGVIQYNAHGEVALAVTFDSNQIKSATENIGTFDKNNPDIRYSTQETDNITDRHLLANAFEGISQNSVEYKMIQDYKAHIKELNELESKLSDLNAEIRKIRFGKGEYDAEKLRQLENEAKEIAKEINRYDKRLLNMEASEPLRKVIERERKKEAQKTKDHVKEIQQNKKVRAEQTELRHKIRKTIRDLDKLLNHGNKKTNVKEDMKIFASKALELADYLFTDHISNDDLIRKGITVRMTEKEAALVRETEDILSKLYDHADSLTDEEFTRLDAKRKANEDKLRDLLKAQRNERLNTPVYNLFNDLVTEYASLKNSKQDSVKAAYDEVLENSLRAFMGDEDRVRILKNMRVADMTTEELNWLYRAYTMVLTNVRNANKFHVKGITETIEQRVGRIAGDFSSRKIPDKKAGIIARNLANKIGWDYEKLYYALDRIGSEAFTALVMNIANSENTVMQDVMEAAAFRDEMVEKYGFNNWDVNKEIDREFLDNTGKKFKLTLGQLMALYAYSRREGAWDHIEYGGFVFGEAALTNPRPADSYKLSKEQCEAITSLLTEKQRGYAEAMQKYLSETMGEKGNEVSMMLYGIKMFGEKNYFPIHIAGQFKAQANESQAKAAAGFSSMSNAGFTHAQNPNAKAPFVLEGFNEIWVDHVNEMSRYHGTVPALEDMRRVMNRSSYSESGMESMAIKQLMENSYGKEAVEYFDNLYREANSGAITDKLQKNSKKLLSLFRKNSVAYSLSVLIQQPAAMVRAYDLIDRKYFGFKGFGTLTSGIAKAVSDKWTKAHTNAYNEMLKYAPGVTMAKEIGGFDTATGGSIRSYLLDTNKSLSQKWKTGTAIEKGSAVMDLVDNNAVANLPNLADKIAWIEIWNACKRETVAKHKDLATNSEEFMQAVGERFTEVIRATQVYDSIFAKSPMLKSKNLAVQYLVSFMNEPNTVANMVEKAVRDATKGDWKSGAKTAAVVVHSIIFTNVLKSLVYAMRDEDEDETYIEKYIEAVAGNMMSDFNALNYIPIARDVVSLAQGYDVERADMAIVADALDALNRVIKNGFTETEDMTEEQLVEFDKKCTEANWKLVESVAAFFGIPVKNIRREIEGVINTAKNTAANNGQTTLLSAWEKVYDAVIESIPFMQAKNTKQDKLYEAIMAGDQAYLSRLKSTYKDDSAYQSAVRKALRENDSRIHDAAQAKYEGRTDEYKRIFREIQKEGKFSFDDIMSAVNSEESAIRNKLEHDKATSSYTASDFVESIVLGDSKSAEAMKEDIIATKVANGKTQADAEKEFISSVATGIRDAYSSGLLDEAGAEKMLMEYADKDEEEAASKVGYWGFCEDNPKYDYFTESNVKDYREFAEPENISLEVYAQFINGTKGLADIKDKWGDVEVTKREQVLEVIDSLPLTWQQKDALYLAAGYSESKIWDVPW